MITIKWFIINIIGMLVICTVNLVNRNGGVTLLSVHIPSYVYFVLCSTLLTGWMIPISYEVLGKYFIQLVMVGNVILTIGGFIGAYYVFHDPLTVKVWIGSIVSLIGIIVMFI